MGKKVLSTLMALVLAVGLCPAAALADGGEETQLKAASVLLQARGAGAVALSSQSVKAKSEDVSSYALVKRYQKVLKQAIWGEGRFKDSYESFLEKGWIASWETSYALRDMDGDGVPELLVKAGVYSGGGEDCYVYTIRNSALKFCGKTNVGFGGISDGNDCLYVFQAHFDLYYWSLRLVGNRLVRESAYSGTIMDESAMTFRESAGIRDLAWSQCSSYSLLKQRAKVSNSLFKAKVSVSKRAKYTGKKIKPKVKVKYLGKKLKKGRDFKVIYKNSQGKKISAPKAVGTYKVIVKGKGSFKGKVTKTFKVKKAR